MKKISRKNITTSSVMILSMMIIASGLMLFSFNLNVIMGIPADIAKGDYLFGKTIGIVEDENGKPLWIISGNWKTNLHNQTQDGSNATVFDASFEMIIIEIPFWKRWKLTGILEWHENQVLTCKIFRLSDTKNYFWGIFLLHFLNGGLGGIGLLLALVLIPYLQEIPMLIIGLLYAFFLWIITLVPIHKPITGINPWNHPLGKGPIIISLLGHAVYGITLAIIFLIVIFP